MSDHDTSDHDTSDLATWLDEVASGADGAPVEAPGVDPGPRPDPRSAKGHRQVRPDAILLPVGVIVACAGIAFAIGRVTAPAAGGDVAAIMDTSAAAAAGATAQQGGMAPPGMDASAGTMVAGGPPGAAGGSPSIDGTVSSVADGELTITLADGSTRTIATSADTGYHTEAAAAGGDVAVGMTVSVRLGATPGASADPSAATAAAADVTILDE